jgi:uncharacterized protein (PEP-CTERM system associated)
MVTDMAMAGMASTARSSNAGLFLLACLVSTATWAGDWKFASGVTFSERYSDNVNLDVAGSEQAEWVTEISPRISVRRDGARIKANLDYSLQGLLYANGVGSNKINHNLNGRASTELVEEWFFLDATARMSQELNSLSGGTNVGGPVGIANTTSVGAYSLSPYLKHRFGSFATVEAKLSRDGVFIGDSTLSDSASTRYTFSAVSGNYFFPLSWGANYSKSDTSNSGATDSGSEQASVNARYSLSRQFGLLANASMEKNDFTGVSAAARDYSSYGLGMFYTPSRRISMDALYNHSDSGNFVSGSVTLNPTLRTTVKASSSKRAFGRSYSLSLAHRTRQSNWNLSYSDDLTTSQQQYLNYSGVIYAYLCPVSHTIEFLPYGVAPSDPGSCIRFNQYGSPSLAQINQTYVSKNLVGVVGYSLRRNTWLLSVFDTRREFQGLTGGSDTTRGLQASWSLKPAAHTTFTLTGGMSHVESIGTPNRQDDLWNIALVATHQFQPKVSGSLEARHQERKSSLAGSDFTENSVAARMNLAF